MGTRLHDYRRLLLDRLRRHEPAAAELARKSPADLFDWLIVQPLGTCIDGGRRGDRFVLVIDALDETIRDGHSALADVLAEAAPRLPGWMALVVTSRRDSPVLRQFAGVREQPIAKDADDNRADLRVYAQAWLGASGRPAAEVAALIDRIEAASDGNFLYLRMLREGVAERKIELDAPEGLPPGLVGLYERWFRRQFPDVAEYERDVLPVLEVMAAAEHPVPEAVLTGLFGWNVRQRAKTLESLGSLFERRADGIAPFHKSLRDWLTDERAAGAHYVTDAAAGRELLFGYLWDRFVAEVPADGADMPDALRLDQPLASQELAADVFDLANEMLRDVEGWEHLFRVKPLEAP